MNTPNSAPRLTEPAFVERIGDQIRVELSVDDGMLTAIGHLQETIDLGVLPHGNYDYSVQMFYPYPVYWGEDKRMVMGSFMVAPEPGAAALAAISALGVLTRWSRRRRSP